MVELGQGVDLRDEISRLGPWHHEVEVGGVNTFGEEGIPFRSSRESVVGQLNSLFPSGLEGRSVLDCACNCGAFLFWAKELGAGKCFGFDVREHWIAQARFLEKHRRDGVRFEVLDLYDLPKLELEPFDIVFFKGIFYHLPEPILGLKIAADLTKQVMIFDTATHHGEDGSLVLQEESESLVLSGVYGLNWLPTGPEVMSKIMRWAGFQKTRVVRFSRETQRLWMFAFKEPLR